MKKIYLALSIFIILFLVVSCYVKFNKKDPREELKTISVTVIGKEDNNLIVQDDNNILYTFNYYDDIKLGNKVIIEYMGELNKYLSIQDVVINNIEIKEVISNDNSIPEDWLDEGIFKQYYKLAYEKLKTMTLEEKVGQLLLVRYNDDNVINDLNRYHFGGYVFYEKDFRGKTEEQVTNMIKNVQDNSKIPLLIAVDEEGGRIVRVSSNPNLVEEPFKSSSELYETGGLDLIKEDTINKSKVLRNLGINLNLAPVVDITTNSSDYIYDRTLKQDTETTSLYAKTVIEASKGKGVSYTLKHFPGYGSNSDTHTGVSIDNKSLEDIKTYDIPPFKSGIDAGAESILFSHNVVNALDNTNPVSLSLSAHNYLRNDLSFTGIIMTDDIGMDALDDINNKAVKSLLAGNDLIITTDYKSSFEEIKNGLSSGVISEDLIDKLCFRILSWKYYKGILNDEK